MLQLNKPQLMSVPDRGGPEPEFVSPRQLYSAIEGFIRRQHPLLAFVLLLTLGLAAVYLAATPPKYTSEAVVMIDAHKTQLFQQAPLMSDLSLDSATIDTQLEILRSENIALSVVRDLHLADVPEFSRPRPGFLQTILGLFTNLFSTGFSSDPPSDTQLTRTAVGTLLSRLNVRRVGMTYVIQIDFQSFDPERAAQVANTVADAYIVDSLEAKYQATRRATLWLQDRLKELREQSSNAERAVVDFKAKNDIVETGTGGRLMNEQQLAELNTQLIQARAHTAETRARLDRVQQILKSDPDSAATATPTVADTLHNDVITRLRSQYLDLQAHESDWSKRFGSDHLAVVNVRNQMREIRHNILDELQRIAETYKSDYEIARTREESVQKSLAEIVAQSQTTNEAQVTLHSLESSAQTYKSLYEHFLQRYMESVQQQSFPVSDARVITQATRGYQSYPNRLPIIAGSAAAGIFLGIAIGLLRELSDRVFRTRVQVEEYLQADCIAVVPLMKNVPKTITSDIQVELGPVPKVAQSPLADVTDSIDAPILDSALKGLGEANEPVAIVPLGPRSEPAAKAPPRTLRRDDSMLWATTHAPFSRFTESIRAIKVAADLQRLVKENKVIGITSSVPNEGKTTLAMVFAGLIGQSGKVALLDCDLRNPSLTRALAPGAKLGILEVISGKAVFDQVVWNDPVGKLVFMPAVVQSRLAHSSEILASDAMRKLFGTLRAAYDYVIVDLSPLAPVVDVRAMTHLVDSFVFVVEWGRTRIDVAEHALNMARGVHENLLGVVLNKVNLHAMWRYEASKDNYYYKRYFARYGYTE